MTFMQRWTVAFTLALVACSAPRDPLPTALRKDGERVLIITRGSDSGTLDVTATASPHLVQQHLLDVSADAVIVRRTLGTLVLNRGRGGNVMVLNHALELQTQFYLGACNPQDAEYLDVQHIAVVCYDHPALWIIDLAQRSSAPAVDLTRFALPGNLPRAAHLLRDGNKLYVSIQRLNENYVPKLSAMLAVIDIDSLRLSDSVIALPCTNPVSNLVQLSPTVLSVACAGSWNENNRGAALVAVDTTTGHTRVIADGEQLSHGRPGDQLRRDAHGNLLTLLSIAHNLHGAPASAMHVIRVSPAGDVAFLHSTDEYSLAGLAVDHAGTIYVGNRSQANAGLWVLHSDGHVSGPIPTRLPPNDLDIDP